jgi:hypothetical protein
VTNSNQPLPPVSAALVTWSGPGFGVTVFEIVMVLVRLLPGATTSKSTSVTAITALVPVPLRVAFAFAALLVTLSVVLREPTADGLNTTVIGAVAPGAIVVPLAGSSVIVKSLACMPLTSTSVRTSGMSPLFPMLNVRSTVFGVAAFAARTAPKS